MKPEISHRCPSCGVSVRDQDALFCYECGKPLAGKAKQSEPAETGEVSHEAAVPDESQPAPATEATAAEPKTEGKANPPASEPAVASADKPDEMKPDASFKPDESTSPPPAAKSDASTKPDESTSTPPAAKSDASLKPDESTSTPPAARRGDKTRERLHRASEVARGVTRGVIEEPAKRVEKIRHVSNVVIEEASYDPSLRFVLVALGLFVVFVILLVLSKVMG